jgi:DNA-binding response OmpR family regulator
MDVVLVRWPSESSRRERLCESATARLLLVEPGAGLPEVTDPIEDWVRVPADEAEVQARLATLTARARRGAAAVPVLDDDGVLRVGDRWVSLPPVEARIAASLLDRIGAVVHRDALVHAGWPTGSPGRNALDVHVLRLRRRVLSVGLVIRTVRARGYVIEMSDSVQLAERNA